MCFLRGLYACPGILSDPSSLALAILQRHFDYSSVRKPLDKGWRSMKALKWSRLESKSSWSVVTRLNDEFVASSKLNDELETDLKLNIFGASLKLNDGLVPGLELMGLKP